MRAYTWEELAARSLARQFPKVRGRSEAAVVKLVRLVGPIQSQAARAPFLGVAARLPGVSYDAMAAAHRSMEVVRSSSLRGTVHTSTCDQHASLSGVAISATAPLWRRTLKLDQSRLDAFRAELEDLSAQRWVTHDEIETHLRGWLSRHDLSATLQATEAGAGHFAYRTHAAMLRRPRSLSAGWDSQAEVVYRAARYAIDEQPAKPQEALVDLVRHHVAASGPVTRRDLAWWSGAGLRNVDAAIDALREELVARPGPNGLDYLDLTGSPSRSGGDPGIRLLPEYDALLLAYEPAARARFADDEAVLHSWNRANGVHSPTVLVDGRLRGRWRLTRGGDAVAVDVEMFPGERLLDPGDLAAPAAAIESVLGVVIPSIRVSSLVT